MNVISDILSQLQDDPRVKEKIIQLYQSTHQKVVELVGYNPLTFVALDQRTGKVHFASPLESVEAYKRNEASLRDFMLWIKAHLVFMEKWSALDTIQEKQAFVDSLSVEKVGARFSIMGTDHTFPPGTTVADMEKYFYDNVRPTMPPENGHLGFDSSWVQDHLGDRPWVKVPIEASPATMVHSLFSEYGVQLEVSPQSPYLMRLPSAYSNGIDIYIYAEKRSSPVTSPHYTVTSSAPFKHRELHACFHNPMEMLIFFRTLVPRTNNARDKLNAVQQNEDMIDVFCACSCHPDREWEDFESWLGGTMDENYVSYETWHALQTN